MVCNVTTYFENILFLVVTCDVYSVTLVTKFKFSVRYFVFNLPIIAHNFWILLPQNLYSEFDQD